MREKRSEVWCSRISATKSAQLRLDILNAPPAPTQVFANLAIPSHRKHAHITYQCFLDYVAQGKTLNDIIAITSKHLAMFYSVLSKGKINLTREDFVRMYVDEAMPLDDIAQKTGISRENITYLREHYGIKRKGARYQRRMAEEVALSDLTKDVVIGSLLGDGYIDPDKNFTEKHGPEQAEYVEWKASHLAKTMIPAGFDAYKSVDPRSGNDVYTFSLRTKVHSLFYELHQKFYHLVDKNWVKILPPDIDQMINQTVLAVWYMDDGSTDWNYRNGHKSLNTLPLCKIHSQSFTPQENDLLVAMFRIKFGLQCAVHYKIGSTGNAKPYLRFNAESSKRLTEMLDATGLIIDALRYKCNEQAYLAKKARAPIDQQQVFESFCARHNIVPHQWPALPSAGPVETPIAAAPSEPSAQSPA